MNARVSTYLGRERHQSIIDEICGDVSWVIEKPDAFMLAHVITQMILDEVSIDPVGIALSASDVAYIARMTAPMLYLDPHLVAGAALGELFQAGATQTISVSSHN